MRLLALVLLAGCVAPGEVTVLRAYVEGAEVQAEADAEACLLAAVLLAVAEGPAATVEAARFGGRTAAAVMEAHLVPERPLALSHGVALYAGAAEPRTQAALRGKAAEAAAGRGC